LLRTAPCSYSSSNPYKALQPAVPLALRPFEAQATVTQQCADPGRKRAPWLNSTWLKED
jgi:hypothetical protein